MLNVNELVKATKGKLLNGDGNTSPLEYEIDSRILKKDDFFVPIVGEKVDAHIYIIDTVKKGAIGFFINSGFEKKDEIIKESIKINENVCIIEVEDTRKALIQSGIYNRQKHINIPVVAIAGSVGKTSTREMIASVLKTNKNVLVTKKNYNSDIGLPLMCLQIDEQDVCVLEVGIDKFDQMDELSFILKPDIVVFTIIGTSHIGTFKTKENIFKEKFKLTNYIKGISKVIVNGDDTYLASIKANEKINVESYTIDTVGDVKVKDESLDFVTRIYGKEEKVVINQIGNHNIYNALAAIKVGELFNLETKDILKGIAKYENFSRRLERKVINNVTLIDDSYNASPESMKSGLMSADKISSKRKFAIIGDIFDLGELAQEIHMKIAPVFELVNFDYLYTLGPNAKYIANGAKKYMNEEKIKSFDSKKDLVGEIIKNVKEGDLVYFKASNGMNFNEIVKDVYDNLKNK